MNSLSEKCLVFLGLLLIPFILLAQNNSDDYPDMIIYNAKVVTMDDVSFSPDPGTIFQAIAVREDKIIALGNNQDIIALAGPLTKQIDIKGRTILPSFILTHGHPTDRIWESGGYALRHILQEGNEHIVIRFLKGNAEEQIASWENVLKEVVETASPGQWILLGSDWGGNYENMPRLITEFWRHISLEKLDELAPNNPVRIKNSTVDGLLNTRGLEEVKKVFPTYTARGNRGPTGRMLEP